MRAVSLVAGTLCVAVMVAAPPRALPAAGPVPTAVAAPAARWSGALADVERLTRAADVARARAALRRARRELAAANRAALRMRPGARAIAAMRAVAVRRGIDGRRLLRLIPAAPRALRADLARAVRVDVRAQRRLARRLNAVVARLGRSPAARAARRDRSVARERRALERAVTGALANRGLPSVVRRELAAAVAAAPPRARAAPASRPEKRAEPRVEREIPYAQVASRDGPRELMLDAYLPPAGGGPRPGVLLIHGGAWRDGDRTQMAEQARALAERGFAAFAIEYRLDSEVPFPDEIEDVRAAVRWVRANADRFGVDPARIGALGGSAGGNLAALVGVMGEGPLDRGDRLAAVASWSGPMYLPDLATDAAPREGCTPTGALGLGSCDVPGVVVQAFAALFIGCPLDDLVPWVSDLLRPSPCPDVYEMGSPVLRVSGDDPPFLLALAESDPMASAADAERMAGALREAGVPVEVLRVPGEAHAHALHDQAFEATADFFARHLGDPEG